MNGDELNWMETDDGNAFMCQECDCNQAVTQYFGFCPECWVEKTAGDRAVLRGEEPPVKEVIQHTIRQTVYPEPRPELEILKFLWRCAITAAVAWLIWRTR